MNSNKKKTKIILLRPPDPMGMVDLLSHTQPTNIGYLAAYVKRAGFEAEIWDYEQTPFTAVGFLNQLKEVQPAAIGFSCMTPTIINGHNIATLAKKHFPHIVTVVGGAHSSAMPKETMQEFVNFDLVVNQEGENTFLEICERLEVGDKLTKIQGTTWRDGDDLVKEEGREFISDLDTIPFPARELYMNSFNREGHSTRGFANSLRNTEIFTSRGCPYKCTFCAIVATFNRSLRFRETDAVFDEIKECQERYKTEHFVIADDTFGLKSRRLETLCEGFKRLKVKSWNCDTRVDAVNKESLKMMVDSGCTKVAFGVETGSPRIVELNQKNICLDQVEESVRWAHEAGVKHVEANFIVGSHPDEKPEDLEMTAQLIRKLRLTFVSISVIVPYPGTPNFSYMKERDQIKTYNWDEYVMFGKAPKWRTTYFAPEDLLANQKRLNRAFYLNPKYMARMLSQIRSIEELSYYAKAGKSFLKWLVGIDLSSSGSHQMNLDDKEFVVNS